MQQGAYPRCQPAINEPDTVVDVSFDYGAGADVVDFSGHNNHLTLSGCTPSDIGVGLRNRGYSMHFDGTNDWCKNTACIGGISGQRVSTRLAFWMLDNALDTNLRVTIGLFTSSCGPQIVGGVPKYHLYGLGMDKTSNQLSAISAGTWYHMGCSHDNVTVQFEHNGGDYGNPAGSITSDYNQTVTVGADSSGGFDHEGRLSECMLFKRTLTLNEMRRHYDQPRMRYNNAAEMVGGLLAG